MIETEYFKYTPSDYLFLFAAILFQGLKKIALYFCLVYGIFYIISILIIHSWFNFMASISLFFIIPYIGLNLVYTIMILSLCFESISNLKKHNSERKWLLSPAEVEIRVKSNLFTEPQITKIKWSTYKELAETKYSYQFFVTKNNLFQAQILPKRVLLPEQNFILRNFIETFGNLQTECSKI